MSKKYKGKTCVYCGDAADGADHVFAREFFLKSERGNLPKVPACSDCNKRKSDLEHYAVTVLPFAGRHRSARSTLEDMVPRRLAKNAPLHREIEQGLREVWTQQGSLILPTVVFPIDSDRIDELFRLIARGLLAFHFSTILSSDDQVELMMLNSAGTHFFEDEFFAPHADHVVSGILGEGTVVYEGLQASDRASASVWRILMYGGAWLGAESGGGDAVSSVVGVITGPASLDISSGT